MRERKKKIRCRDLHVAQTIVGKASPGGAHETHARKFVRCIEK